MGDTMVGVLGRLAHPEKRLYFQLWRVRQRPTSSIG
jgi:hypothetical protein